MIIKIVDLKKIMTPEIELLYFSLLCLTKYNLIALLT